jgi:hypothetical protein
MTMHLGLRVLLAVTEGQSVFKLLGGGPQAGESGQLEFNGKEYRKHTTIA